MAEIKKGMRCPNCGQIVKHLCAYCWRCESCCNCNEKGKRFINGKLEKLQEKSEKKNKG